LYLERVSPCTFPATINAAVYADPPTADKPGGEIWQPDEANDQLDVSRTVRWGGW
jgi:hypothetical protein